MASCHGIRALIRLMSVDGGVGRPPRELEREGGGERREEGERGRKGGRERA